MKRKYTLFQQPLAYALAISLLLQSCGESLPILTADTQPLIGEELVAQGGHSVTFYEQAGELKANVVVNATQGFSKTYKNINVYVEQGTELIILPQLDRKAQQHRIHLYPAKSNQPAKVVVYKGAGLNGGGSEEEDNGIAIPDECFCPITYELMENPVVAQDGHTYERSAIECWFATGSLTSPKTGASMTDNTLRPNYALRSLIQDLKRQNSKARKKNNSSKKKGKEKIEDNDKIIGLRCSDFKRDHEGNMPLHLAIKRAGLDIMNMNGDNLLISATRKAHIPAIRELLMKDVSAAKAKNNDGWTPLHIAVRHGYTEAAELLIGQGADKEVKQNNYGYTPLHIAAQNCHIEVMKYLIDQGANKEAIDDEGGTPLYIAARKGYKEAVELLVDQGANKEVTNKMGITPLNIATFHGNLDVVKYLIDKGANKNNIDKHDYTSLHRAAQSGVRELVKLLINQRAGKDAKDNDGYTPLYIATRGGNIEIVKYLMSKGANKKAKDNDGRTLLYIAALYGHTETAKYLIDKGANKNATDKHGYTPLHIAAQGGHIEIVRYLISKGADKEVKTKYGDRAIDMAREKGHYAIVDILNRGRK